jgi:hypothetical protein
MKRGQWARAGRRGGHARRSALAGVCLSVALHLGAVVPLARWRAAAAVDRAGLDGHVTLVPLDEPDPALPSSLALTVETIDDQPPGADAPAPAPPPAAPVAPRRVRRPAPAPTSAVVATSAPADAPATTLDEAAAPGSPAPPAPAPTATPVFAAAGVPALATANTSLAAHPAELDDALAPRPTVRPALIGPGVARGLRLYDDFPSLPEHLRNGHFRRTLVASVCVSSGGAVSDVHVAAAGVPPLEDALRRSIRTWRYRPLMVDGAATPFCHEIAVHYREQ